MWVRSLGQEDHLEKGIATHSSGSLVPPILFFLLKIAFAIQSFVFPQQFKDFLSWFWRRKWQPTPVLLPGKSRGQRSAVGYSPWGPKESDTTERLPFHFSVKSAIGNLIGTALNL